MNWIYKILANRKAKWLFVIIGVIAMVALTPIANQDKTTSEQTAFLPKTAQSTKVVEAQQKLSKGKDIPALVVYERGDGLTADDYKKITDDIVQYRLIAVNHTVDGPIPSKDTQAVLVTFSIKESNDITPVTDKILSQINHDKPSGLKTSLTGAAGVGADQTKAFSGVNGKLLLASIGVVALLLLITYRSPVLWLLPLLVVGAADQTASALANLMSEHFGLVLNGENTGILRVLVFGAGTDYALLIIARYREELHRHSDRHEAMAQALRNAVPALFASASTVILALLSLLAAVLNNDRTLGPVGAIGIGSAFLFCVLVLPSVLLLFGRWIFWPRIPHQDNQSPTETGIFARLGQLIARRPWTIGVVLLVGLAAASYGLWGAHIGLKQSDSFRGTPQSIEGQRMVAKHFSAGASSPLVIIASEQQSDVVKATVSQDTGVNSVLRTDAGGGVVSLSAVLADEPDSEASYQTVQRLRDALGKLPNAGALVGGPTAINYDIEQAAEHDRKIVLPIILGIVLVVLIVLLRSLVAPLILTATVVLSFLAALGLTNLISMHIFNFPALDVSVPLLGFVFLVALGVDYNIFLVTRAAEEIKMRGLNAGILHALAVTGGVITSAGVVLAATFGVLGVLPLVLLTQIGILVAVGVLIDTLLVRSLLVPAIALVMGRRFWWPRFSNLPTETVDHTKKSHQTIQL